MPTQLPFEAQFFHRGLYQRAPVRLHEITPEGARAIFGADPMDSGEVWVEGRRMKRGDLREALARDKTRTQVFDISELGLVEMTRKRIGEGLLVGFTEECETCRGRGVVFDKDLLDT